MEKSKKIGKILLLVLGIVLIVLSVKALAELPGQKSALEAAVCLDEPKVLAQNEGRLVIVHGTPEMISPAYDYELKLTLQTLKAHRYKEVYKQTGHTDEEQKWEWVPQEQTTLTGRAALGEFELDAGILAAFPAESPYTDFDPAETAAYHLEYAPSGSSELYVLPNGGYYADALVTGSGDDRSVQDAIRREAECLTGAEAFRYRFCDPEKNGVMTVAGIQQGNRLIKDETLGAIVQSGVKSKEDLLSSNTTATVVGSVVFVLLGAVCIFFALRKPKVEVFITYEKELMK